MNQIKQDNIKYGARGAVNRLAQLLIDRELPFTSSEVDDLYDLLTFAAVDDLLALTRMYLWYMYESVGIGAVNPVRFMLATQLTTWYCGHFPEVVMQNVTTFADCCGPMAMKGISFAVPDVGKYLRSQGMQYCMPDMPIVAEPTPKKLRAKLRTAKAFRSLQLPA